MSLKKSIGLKNISTRHGLHEFGFEGLDVQNKFIQLTVVGKKIGNHGNKYSAKI